MTPKTTMASPLDHALTGAIAYIEMDKKDAQALLKKIEADRKQAKRQARKERRTNSH